MKTGDFDSSTSHLPWRPPNLNVSFQRRFLLPPLLFTQQMKYRLRIIAQWQKFQGNLRIWENGISGLQFSCLTKLFTQESNN